MNPYLIDRLLMWAITKAFMQVPAKMFGKRAYFCMCCLLARCRGRKQTRRRIKCMLRISPGNNKIQRKCHRNLKNSPVDFAVSFGACSIPQKPAERPYQVWGLCTN